jgi:hypothetical protein
MKIPVFMQACPATAHFKSASESLDPSCLQCAPASEHVAADAGKAKRQVTKTAAVSIRIGANPGCGASTHHNQNAEVAGKSLFRRPAQRAVRPSAGRRVLQRLVAAIGAEIPQLPIGAFVGHSFDWPAARRARLPNRIGHWHLISPATVSLRPPP